MSLKEPGMISSLHNSKVQLIRALLGRPKERREAQAFAAEGIRLVEEAQTAGWPFRFVLAGETLSERGNRLVRELEENKVEVERVSDSLLGSVSGTETSQGILAVLEIQPLPLPETLDFVLIADQIRDPGNLGTLMRTAAAAGVQAVLLSPETTDPFAPKVVRAGMGAHFRLPIRSLAWDEIRSQTAGLKIYLAETEGAIACWQADFRSPLALIVGGEAEGASQAARALASRQVFIPMPGKTESLNAGIAGAILLFEVVRQRK
jgi:RNA methyltransferase, TrmH family